jgi:hypothetical protein
MNNNGILRDSNVIKLIPDQSVVKLHIGDPIRLTAQEFERLSAAFFAEIERKSVAHQPPERLSSPTRARSV